MDPYAIIFPGQGSQVVGMLAENVDKFSIVSEVFDQASAVLQYDLWELVQTGPEEKLNLTINTQPALLAASYAMWCIFDYHKSTDLPPLVLAGHSLGEYTALVAAKALTFKDAISLVLKRAEYMQEAVADGLGGLAAIVGLDVVAVQDICKDVAGNNVLSAANFNSPMQTVISGHREAVIRAITAAKQQGAKVARMLPVSVPSHCSLMHSAADKFKKIIADINFFEPEIPVISNVDVQKYRDIQSIRSGLIRQLYSPVRWVETIEYCQRLGVVNFFECGPKKVLTGLGKRINSNLVWSSVTDFY